MYSSERAQNVVKKDVAYLAAGIHDNVSFVSVRVDKSINGKNFIEFKFEKDGMGFTHTEYEPRRNDNDTDEKYQEKCDNQFSRIEQILKCFYPNPEDREFSCSNFIEFTKWVVEMLEKADKTILVRVKIVYNDNGYTTFPRYAVYTFIEPMSIVNENKSVIVKLSMDKFEKPIIANLEKPNPNPLQNTVEQTSSININTSSLQDSVKQATTDNTSELPF